MVNSSDRTDLTYAARRLERAERGLLTRSVGQRRNVARQACYLEYGLKRGLWPGLHFAVGHTLAL